MLFIKASQTAGCLINRQGPLHRGQKFGRGIAGELEAGAGAGGGVEFLHGLVQPAGGPDHGNGAVAQAIHLVQAAGFITGGHEKDVGPGDDLVGQFVGEADHETHAPRIFEAHLLEEIMVAFFPGALDDETHFQAHQVIENVFHQVDPFALKEPGGHADERPVRGQIQVEMLQQGGLAGLFPGEVIPVIGRGQEGIPVGVPALIVDPFQNAVELMGPFPEQPLQPEAEFRGQDLFPVFGGYGGQEVRKHQAALHKIELAVKFQGLGREQFPPQAGEGQVIGRKKPLVTDVVDRIDHRQALEAGAVVIEGPEIDGHQAGLPLVGVADVELQFQGVDHLHHRPGKEDEALAIVVKIPVGGAVETFPVKQGVLADEVKIQVGVDLGGKDLGGQGL